MIFNNMIGANAIDIPFNWCAEYVDGTMYTEYDLKTHKKNDFYLIQQNKVLRFGLFGQNMKFFFEYDGVFNLQGRRVEIEYHTENGEVFYLTNNYNQKDLITYKQAYTDWSNTQGVQRSNIESINFGYKTILAKDDVEIFFQPIVSLPMNQSVFIEVKLTSNKDLKGHLVFKVRGQEVERYEAPLEAYKAGQMNWTVK